MATPSRPRRKAAPRQPTRRREIEIKRTREDILVAAARALGRSGYKAVSMQDIADEVGFTAPALYGYFQSKDEIFVELRHMLHREVLATFEPRPKREHSLRDNLTALVRRQLEWADQRREVFVSFMAVHMRGESVGCGQVEDDPMDLSRHMIAWLDEAAAQGSDLGGYDSGDAAAALLGIAHGFFTRWLMAGSAERLADQSERIVDLFLYGVQGRPDRAG